VHITPAFDRTFKRINSYALEIEQKTSNLNTRDDQNAAHEPQSHVPDVAFASFLPKDNAQTVGMHQNPAVKGVLKDLIKTGDS
jgi:hypothetical protein